MIYNKTVLTSNSQPSQHIHHQHAHPSLATHMAAQQRKLSFLYLTFISNFYKFFIYFSIIPYKNKIYLFYREHFVVFHPESKQYAVLLGPKFKFSDIFITSNDKLLIFDKNFDDILESENSLQTKEFDENSKSFKEVQNTQIIKIDF